MDPLTPIVLYPEDGSFSPPLSLEVLPFGLTLNKLLINGDGKTHDILIGPYDPLDHQRLRAFQNPIVGRYANRLPVGEHPIKKDGVQGVVTPILNEGTRASLHGGPKGLDREAFQPVESVSQSKLFTPLELKTLEAQAPSSNLFTFTSPAGDQGYPGQLDVEVIIAIANGSKAWDPKTKERSLGSVILIYRAIVRNDSKAEGDNTKIVTPVNLTHHWGFNLDASLAEPLGTTPDVKKQKLCIDSAHILEGDSDLLPTGKLVEVAGGPFDFSGETAIGAKYPDPGYDHFYLFPPSANRQPTHAPLKGLTDGTQDLVAPIFSSPHSAARLSSEQSGIKLAFSSNQRGVQFYSGIGLDGTGTRKRIHGGSETGSGYTAGSAAFLEFHAPHAAFLKSFGDGSHFKQGDETLLTSDELYHHWVKLDISHVPVPEENVD